MQTKTTAWLWRSAWIAGLLAGLGLLALYTWLPADGATGDLASIMPQGFRVQWLLQDRAGGLRPEDVIVRAGGHTIDEWLSGAPRGEEWLAGSVVDYQVIRDGQSITLPIRLAPIPFWSVLLRWAPQFLVALAFLAIGTFVNWRRPNELAARLLGAFCIIMFLQYLGDAYNFQYPSIPWRWPFWVHLTYEHILYGLGISTICMFAMVFPMRLPLLDHYPRLLPAILYLSFPIVILGTMALSPTWSAALRNSNHASWIVALGQLILAVGTGIRSVRTARDPVTRAQIRWILWCVVVGCAVLIPGYVLPLMITGRAPIPHPVTMIFIVLIPVALGIAILRYRLFDIEIIINRTLVYGTLITILGVIYLLVVRLLTWAIQLVSPQGNDTIAIFGATLTIALAFAPLQQRIQALIDRTFYRTKLDFQRLLPEMSEKVVTSVDLGDLAEQLTQQLPQRLQLSWATLAVVDSKGKHLVRVDDNIEHKPLPTAHPLTRYLYRSGQPLMRLLPPADLPPEALGFLDQHGIELSIPLLVGTELVGLYNLGPKRSGDAYSRDEVRLLHLLGRQAAVAAENGRLFQAERTQRKLTEALQQAAEVVNSALDLELVLDRILEQVERVVAGDAFNIMLIDDANVQVVRWRGYERLESPANIADLVIPITQFSSLNQMLQKGEPIFVQDTTNDPNWTQLPGWGRMRSYLSAPIQVAGQTVGFLNVDGSNPGQFGPEDAQRLQAFAHHAAAALKNAQLYEQAQQEIAERILAEEQIKASLTEKEVLLKEIHHRVKNNLQVISSLLNVQSKYVQDEETLRMLQDSRHRVRSMALVHERLYQAQDLAQIDFAKYIRSLTSYLIRSYGAGSAIKLSVDLGNVSLSVDTAIPCGLILNELISNSFKHAFPNHRSGQIDVSFREHDGGLVLTVRDDGVGMPAGMDFRNTESLGLQLVNTLVHQLEGSIELESSHGTEFRITFCGLDQQGKE